MAVAPAQDRSLIRLLLTVRFTDQSVNMPVVFEVLELLWFVMVLLVMLTVGADVALAPGCHRIPTTPVVFTLVVVEVILLKLLLLIVCVPLETPAVPPILYMPYREPLELTVLVNCVPIELFDTVTLVV